MTAQGNRISAGVGSFLYRCLVEKQASGPLPLPFLLELTFSHHLLRVRVKTEIPLCFLCLVLRFSTEVRLSSRLSVFRASQTRTGHLVNEVVACAIGSTRSGRPIIWMGFSASTVCSQRLASLVTSTLESGAARHICSSAYLVAGLYATRYKANGLDPGQDIQVAATQTCICPKKRVQGSSTSRGGKETHYA